MQIENVRTKLRSDSELPGIYGPRGKIQSGNKPLHSNPSRITKFCRLEPGSSEYIKRIPGPKRLQLLVVSGGELR